MGPTHRFSPLPTLMFAFAACGLAPTLAGAQSLCDLLPASVVKSTLAIPSDLTARPDTTGCNGCNYTVAAPGPITVMADVAVDNTMTRTFFDAKLRALGQNGQTVPGMGEAAYYEARGGQQMPKYPGRRFTQQSLVFRAKGKIVSFIVMTDGNGLPKQTILVLGSLILSKPISTLKDPS